VYCNALQRNAARGRNTQRLCSALQCIATHCSKTQKAHSNAIRKDLLTLSENVSSAAPTSTASSNTLIFAFLSNAMAVLQLVLLASLLLLVAVVASIGPPIPDTVAVDATVRFCFTELDCDCSRHRKIDAM
jgi:hypothetical protein